MKSEDIKHRTSKEEKTYIGIMALGDTKKRKRIKSPDGDGYIYCFTIMSTEGELEDLHVKEKHLTKSHKDLLLSGLGDAWEYNTEENQKRFLKIIQEINQDFGLIRNNKKLKEIVIDL